MDDILNYERNPVDDYYTILGCDPNSTVEQIQAEYRVLALKLHPDKNQGDPEAESRFQLLQTAKDVLCDQEKRAKYDKWKASGIAMSFEQWTNLKSHMTSTMHWATPQTKDRMLVEGTCEAGVADAVPAKESLQQRRRSDFTPVRASTTEAWDRDKSEVLRKFRNYEI